MGHEKKLVSALVQYVALDACPSLLRFQKLSEKL